MPTYDYLCRKCDHQFEQFQSITSNPLRKCPECGKIELKRLIGSGAGIIFKGSGFYETDYRSENYKTGQKKDKTSSSDTKTKDKAKDSVTDKKTKQKTKNKKT